MTSAHEVRRVTVPRIRSMKRGTGADPIVMVTAYDCPGAAAADAAGVDIVLVGDSLGMVVLGHEDTLQVSIEEMAHHVRAVSRARPKALVVADLPWMTYHLGAKDAVRNAATLVRAGAQAVKLEGRRRRVAVIKALVGAEIPVMGHLGLTPQSINAMVGFKVQARHPGAAEELGEDARALEDAGCFSIVLEGIPDVVAAAVTDSIGIPTIGIGAGAHCDGQVLVYHDLLGMTAGDSPKFVRKYADLRQVAVDALKAFCSDVREGRFPTSDESYHGSN